MTPEQRAELVKEWQQIAALLKDVPEHSEQARILLARQQQIAVEIGEAISKDLHPRT